MRVTSSIAAALATDSPPPCPSSAPLSSRSISAARRTRATNSSASASGFMRGQVEGRIVADRVSERVDRLLVLRLCAGEAEEALDLVEETRLCDFGVSVALFSADDYLPRTLEVLKVFNCQVHVYSFTCPAYTRTGEKLQCHYTKLLCLLASGGWPRRVQE